MSPRGYPERSSRSRRLQVRKIGDCLQRYVELSVRESLTEAWLGLDHGLPARRIGERCEQLARPLTEALDNRRVELCTAPLPRHRHRCVDATLTMEDLDHVRDLHQPHRSADRRAGEPPGISLAIPTLEDLKQGLAHRFAEPESSGEIARDQAMRPMHRLDRLATRRQERERGPSSARRWVSRAHMPDDEPRLLHPDQVGRVDVRAGADVVAEPPRLLVGIGMTADPREQRDVVHDQALRLVQLEHVGEAQGEHAFPEDMLHRLT
jgi:hypothetical protein